MHDMFGKIIEGLGITKEDWEELVRRYGKRTDHLCIKTPLGLWTSPLSTKGNRKYLASGKVRCVSLPAVRTCKAYCKGCYALRDEKLYKDVYYKRLLNYVLQLVCRAWYFGELKLELQNVQLPRLFDSGDVPDEDYLERLDWLVGQLERSTFFQYVKAFDARVSRIAAKHANWRVIRSYLPDGSINFGGKDYILEKSKQLHVPICPAYTLNGKHRESIHCMVECHACLDNEYVLFPLHGGKGNMEKDLAWLALHGISIEGLTINA